MPSRECGSRRHGNVCTRASGHPGLHWRRGTNVMWSDREQDPPGCQGSGQSASSAPLLADGYPYGRALCPLCLGFVELTAGGRLVHHDTWRGTDDEDEASHRREWFNAHGW